MIIDQVKDRLDITWDDENEKIQGIIDRAKANLNSLAGVELDFSTPGLAQTLLLEYCRYIYNNAAEYFEENFHGEIMRLQLQTGISELGVSLIDITIEDVELNPEFQSTITDYTATTSNESNNIEVEPRKAEADISITVNNESIENDTAYTWQTGDNTVEIIVSKDGNSRIYTVVVTYEI